MFSNFNKIVAVAVFCLLSLYVYADNERITVTATRASEPADRFGGTVSVITHEDIERYQYHDLTAALRSVPGVYVSSSGGWGSQTSLFIRGTESDHVLVLIDGIETTTPFRFEQFQLSGVERIEILRGTHSAQHGSEAIGGIINIVTKKASDKPRVSISVSGGSWDTYQSAVNLSGKYEQFDFSLSSAYLDTAGESNTAPRLQQATRDNDGYRNIDHKLNVGWELNRFVRVDGYYGYVDTPDTEYDLGVAPYESDECRALATAERKGVKLSAQRGIWSGYWQVSDYRREARNKGCFNSFAKGKRDKIEWHNRFQLNSFTALALGMETELERINTGADSRHYARNHAIYAETNVQIFPGMTLNGSVRNDDTDDFGSKRSVRMSAVYVPNNQNWRVHTGYGTGFKAPSLCDRFCYSSSNPDLDAERNDSWEIGFEKSVTASLRSGVVYFENSIRDLIEYDFASRALTNKGKAKIRGVETFIVAELNDAMKLRADYTLLSAHDDEHQRLLRRPLRKATLHWTWQPLRSYSLSARMHYTGPRKDVRRDTFERVAKGGYTLFHVAARKQFTDHVGVNLRIDNLLDKEYEPVDGYQGNGLSTYLGITVDY